MTNMKIWEQRVAAWRSSGRSARAFAEGREFSVHMLRYRARQVEETAAKSVPTASTAAKLEVRLARVIRPGAEPAVTGSREVATAAGVVVIEVGGARVAVTPGFDRSTLAAVLGVLGEGGRS